MALLTVRGRKSGEPRTTPVALVERDNGQYWLMAPYGSVNWVRNLRAAGEGVITRGRHSERVLAEELSTQEAAPILKETLARAPSFLRAYFDVTPDSPLAEFEQEALRHPVFLLKSSSIQEIDRKNMSDARAALS